jgi:mersacidin/lichenicidin family type 2 lantibiotic
MKKNIDLARAWRDEDYYLSLSEEDRARLGAHPAGSLNEEALRAITGGEDLNAFTVLGSTIACTACPGKFCAA